MVVSDGETGREIWSAELKNPDGHGVAIVEVGVLPGDGWVERAPFTADTRPTAWRFKVGYSDSKTETIQVADKDLDHGFLIVPGVADPVAVDAFGDDVCGEGIGFGLVPSRYVALGAGIVALVVIAAALSSSRRRRDRPA